MVQINELSANMSAQSFNQMTRWVNTKEEHCAKIITSIGEYCLCQRVRLWSPCCSRLLFWRTSANQWMCPHNQFPHVPVGQAVWLGRNPVQVCRGLYLGAHRSPRRDDCCDEGQADGEAI
jgi:hypothetical protein